MFRPIPWDIILSGLFLAAMTFLGAAMMPAVSPPDQPPVRHDEKLPNRNGEDEMSNLELITDAISLAHDRVSRFPGPTCADINALLKEHEPIMKLADKLERQDAEDRDPADIEELIKITDAFHYKEFEPALEALRAQNDELRTALHEALAHKSEIADLLRKFENEFEHA